MCVFIYFYKYLCYQLKAFFNFYLISYSYRNASIGFMLAAFTDGISPKITMKKSFIRHIFAVSILSCCLLFGGCSQNSDGEDTSSATTASTSPSETVAAQPADVSPDSDSSAIESTSEDTRALTLSVVNMCGIEIGMVAVIDPVTGEQVNLDSLSDQESISMEADWPSSVNEFQWALYNTDGELCVEGTTDISSAQATVTLLLTGDGDLEKVEELFE